jgi:tetratricopeptide (TPR) repeat protein
VWFYLGKLIWPVNLTFIYPRWNLDAVSALKFLPGLLLAAIFGLAWRWRHSWGRPVLMLMVCYVGLLLPVLGFVNIYFMEYSLVADHWQYAAMIAPCTAFAGAAAVASRRRWANVPSLALRASVALLGLALLAALATLTWRQSRMYADMETLYQRTIERNPECWLANYNLGVALAGRGRIDEAIEHYRKTLEIKSDYAEAHNNLGLALVGRGRIDEAIEHYEKALKLAPGHTQAHINLGAALAARGQIDEAIEHYQRALEINPDCVEACNNLGLALAGRGRFDEAMVQYRKALDISPEMAEVHHNFALALAGRGRINEAIAQYRTALELKPDYAEAHFDLGLALAGCGRIDEAIEHYQKAVNLKPDYAEAHVCIGTASAGRGRIDEAIEHYQKALNIKPDDVEAHGDLGNVLATHGRFDEAMAHYRKALKIEPDCAAVLNDLAWLRATCPEAVFRNGAAAIELAQRAIGRSGRKPPEFLDTLAAAYAEAGMFSKAKETAHAAVSLAQQQKKEALVETLKARLRLYEAGTPYRDAQQPSPH